MKLPFVFAKRFVAGEEFSSSVPAAKQLNQAHHQLTLDLLGENVTSRSQADQNVEAYIDVLKGIEQHKLLSGISIKLTMLGLDIDVEYCADNLFTLMEHARSQNQFVRIDMEGSAYTELTLDLFKRAHAEYGAQHIGTVIQAMLHRSKEDIAELASLGADVRLVKGAYKESRSRAYQQMSDIREAFNAYAEVLINNTSFPRFGTHDDQLIRAIRSYLADYDIPSSRVEFQMLYGLREQGLIDLNRLGYPTRVYVPFGTDWFPYFSRRLAERKENIWFVISTLFKR
ncbi:MAG: proline dehydrogenase family protein [Bacteroidetes bacterium]|jgi:proline dehydrogenase|nr:proline dehydrogenase family protein [Bacteroidota bacterium]MDA1126643.1 proline dehydrogenase family protein [Bacteroidota bacterium]